jgi:hypothetical protein
MPRRHVFVALVTLSVCPAGGAWAQQQMASDCEICDGANSGEAIEGQKPNLLKRAWLSVCRDFKRNNNWPDPFVTADRVNTRIPFDLSTANGWRIQNTLSAHHFEDNSPQLTEAGRLKVAAIINETPLAYRAVFVLRDVDPEITAGRVASIQEAVAKVLGDRPPVPVFETYDKPRGTPAYYVDEVTRRYQATIPDPRLPDDDSSSGSSSPGAGYGSGSGTGR